jgi:hypothetical protein
MSGNGLVVGASRVQRRERERERERETNRERKRDVFTFRVLRREQP